MGILRDAKWALRSEILALVDDPKTPINRRADRRIAFRVTGWSWLRPVAISSVPAPAPSFLPQGPASPFPRLGLSPSLPHGRGRRRLERWSRDAQACVFISGLGAANFLWRTLGRVHSAGAKFANLWGDGGEGGAGGRGDGGTTVCVEKAERERGRGEGGRREAERSRESWVPGARAQEPGSGLRGGRVGRGGAGNGEAATRTERWRLSARAICLFPNFSPSFVLVSAPAGLGGDVRVAKGEASLKGPIAEGAPLIPLHPTGLGSRLQSGGQRARGACPPRFVQVHSVAVALFRKTLGIPFPGPGLHGPVKVPESFR